jgi:ribosome-associated protein
MAITEDIQNLIDEMKVECVRLTMEGMQVYDVQGYSPLTDVVFIATATHILQMDAARRSLSFMAKQAGFPVQNPTEDYSEGWLVLDCVDIVIHILVEEKRSFYDLDKLMSSLVETRSKYTDFQDHDQEYGLSEADLDEILEQLTPDEREEFLSNLGESDD